MRNWSHVPPIELFPSPFTHEFVTLRVNPVRRRTLNFELASEPHYETGIATEIGLSA